MGVVLITYFSILAIVLLLFWLMGNTALALISGKRSNVYANLFLSLLIGNMIFVFLVSIFFTHGMTIHLGFVILLIFALFFFKGRKINTKIDLLSPGNIMGLAEMFLLMSIIFLLKYFSIYSSNSIALLPQGDQVFYANCSNFMLYTGYENISMDYTLLIGKGVSPYHYFELWQNAAVVYLFSSNSVLTLTLVTIPAGMIMIVFGFAAILAEFRPLNGWHKLFCLGGLFLSGFSFGLYKMAIPFLDSLHVFTRSAFDYPKLIPLYLFIIPAVLFFIQNEKKKALLIFLCLPLVSISTAIGILAGVAGFLLADRFWKKEYSPKFLIATALVGLYIFAFYKIVAPETNTHIATNSSLENFTSVSYLRVCINIIVGGTLQVLIVFLPFVIGLGLFFRKRLRWQYEYGVILLLYGFSIAGWAALHDKVDSVQVFSNIIVTLFNILAFTALLYALTLLEKRAHQIIATAVLALLVVQQLSVSWTNYRIRYPYSEAYLKNILNSNDRYSSVGAFILTEQNYAQIPFSYISNFVILGDYLLYAKNKTFPMSLSPYNIRLSEDPFTRQAQLEGMHDTPFYVFVENQKAQKRFSSIEQSQVDFIREYKINYLIVTKDVVLPETLQTLIDKVITDKLTGERFILLKRSF